MITDVVQSIINPIVNAFSPIVESDILPTGVFAVHQEDIIETFRDKSGIYGYLYNVSIIVVAEDQEALDPITGQVIDALCAMYGLITGTVVDEVLFQSTNGVAWDDEKKKYYDQITFTIQTKNR